MGLRVRHVKHEKHARARSRQLPKHLVHLAEMERRVLGRVAAKLLLPLRVTAVAEEANVGAVQHVLERPVRAVLLVEPPGERVKLCGQRAAACESAGGRARGAGRVTEGRARLEVA